MDERRRYERVSFFCRLTITPVSGGPPFEAQSVDISLGGVGIASRKLVAVGQLLAIAFHVKTPAQKEAVEQVFGKVVRVVSDIDGHHLGIDFIEPLKAAQTPELCRKVERL
jgi:c-di-GMP-binding flagellar brake protein YcgR